MSHLFADIYDGIRCLRILKGVPEKDILNYVQARVGNMKVGNVLKTIRTLRKLVDEGILIKKGKRYSFSGKCPKRDCYESEEDNQGDECDEDDECDLDDDDAKDEQDEDDEDDDDDDDDDGCGDEDGEEDDFDDDDDDENCKDDNQEGGDNPGKDEKKIDEANAKEGKKIDSKSSFIMKPKVEEKGENNTMRGKNNATDKTREDVETRVSEPERDRKKESKRRRNYVEQASETENRAQGSAFCARDFLDSLHPSKAEDAKKNPEKSQEKSQSVIESSNERLDKYPQRNRGSRLKWEREAHCSYRSRSPVKGRNRDCYDSLNKGRSNGFGYRSSNALSVEQVDNEGEIDGKKTEPESDGPSPQTNTQEGSQPKDPAKPPSREVKYVLEVVESDVSPRESVDICVSQNKASFRSGSRRNWMDMEDRRQQRTKRSLSIDDVRSYDDKAESLCSVCDKKRRNS